MSAIDKHGRQEGDGWSIRPMPTAPMPYTKAELVSMTNRSAGVTLIQKALTISLCRDFRLKEDWYPMSRIQSPRDPAVRKCVAPWRHHNMGSGMVRNKSHMHDK
jgi:hypothetical protein